MIKKITSQLLLSIAPAFFAFFLIYYLQVNKLSPEQFAKMDYVWGFSKFICSIMILPLPLYYSREARKGFSLFHIFLSTKGIYLFFVSFALVLAVAGFSGKIINQSEVITIFCATLLFSFNQIISSYLIGTSKVVQSSFVKIMPQTIYVAFIFFFDIVDAIIISSLISILMSFSIYLFSRDRAKTSVFDGNELDVQDKSKERIYITLLMLEMNFFLYIDRFVLPHLISDNLYRDYLSLRYLTTPMFLAATFLESFFFNRKISDVMANKIAYLYTPVSAIISCAALYYIIGSVPDSWVPGSMKALQMETALIVAASLILIPASIVSSQFNAQAKIREFKFAVFCIYPIVILSYILSVLLANAFSLGLKGVILALTVSYLVRIVFMRFKPGLSDD